MNKLQNIGYRFSILSCVQLLNIIFPLVLYIILVQRIGLARIGEIMSWQMFILILAGLSNYSFPQNLIPISAKLKSSNTTLKAYWNRLLQIRTTIVLFALVLVLFFSYFIPIVGILSLTILLGKLLNPSSFFYILSYNKALLYANFAIKLTSLIAIYFLIYEDTWYYTNAIIGLVELVVSLILLKVMGWQLFSTAIKWGKIKSYIYKDKTLFYIQFVNLLILLITIPLTQLFFGSYTAGIVSVFEKSASLIRSVSGTLFYTILPYFESNIKEKLIIVIKKIVPKILLVTLGFMVISIACIYYFKTDLIHLLQNEILFYTLLLLMLFLWLPIMLSTPYQIVFLKLNKWTNIFFISRIQLITLVLSLPVLTYFFGTYGLVISILLHEIINAILYKITLDR